MALSKLAQRRLGVLIRFMEALPRSAKQHFHMGMWFCHEGKDDHGFRDGQVISRRDLTACGTQACALGWAATIPSIKKAGLSLHHGGIGEVRWKGKEMSAFDAAANCFDISRNRAHDLFLLTSADTPKQWAKAAKLRIRRWQKGDAR